jgi:hypothetical protein
MLRETKIELVETYLESLVSKDVANVSLADDVTFEGPSLRLSGRRTVLGFLQTIMFPAVKNVRVKQHIVEGDYVATAFEMETTDGLLHVCDLIHVVDGQIKGIQAFFYRER